MPMFSMMLGFIGEMTEGGLEAMFRIHPRPFPPVDGNGAGGEVFAVGLLIPTEGIQDVFAVDVDPIGAGSDHLLNVGAEEAFGA